jgi:DNA-directed RNA polymerase subunit RPC12/RpoP
VKLKIICPQCGKSYKVEADDFKECSFAKCPECGSLIPVERPPASPAAPVPVQVQVVKFELPTVTFEWAFVVLWRFTLATLALAAIPFLIFVAIRLIMMVKK